MYNEHTTASMDTGTISFAVIKSTYSIQYKIPKLIIDMINNGNILTDAPAHFQQRFTCSPYEFFIILTGGFVVADITMIDAVHRVPSNNGDSTP